MITAGDSEKNEKKTLYRKPVKKRGSKGEKEE